MQNAEAINAAYSARTRATVAGVLRNSRRGADVDDCIQEAAIYAWKGCAAGAVNWKARWIAVNAKRAAKSKKRGGDVEIGSIDLGSHTDVDAKNESVLESMVAKEDRARLAGLLISPVLSDRERAAVVARFFQDKSLAEIAVQLGMSANSKAAVSALLADALCKLRAALA